jgi:hypothetical protein
MASWAKVKDGKIEVDLLAMELQTGMPNWLSEKGKAWGKAQAAQAAKDAKSDCAPDLFHPEPCPNRESENDASRGQAADKRDEREPSGA